MRQISIIAVAAFLIFTSSAAQAQQSKDLPPEIVALFADRDAFQTLNREASQQAKEDPRGAVAAYQKFLDDRPKLSAETAYQVGAVMMPLLYQRLHDLASAMAIPDAMMAKYGVTPAGGLVLIEKANILVAEKRVPEAEAIVSELWRKGRWEDNLWIKRQALDAYLNVLQGEGKTEEIESTLRGVLLENPQLMGNGGPRQNSLLDQSLPKRLIDLLIHEKQYEEAISWAKLGYITANVDEKTMADAQATLAQAWTAAGTPGLADIFAKALADAKAPNPLRTVRLPAMDAATRSDRDQALAGDRLRSHDRISLYIADGNFRKAMLEARRALAANPEGSGRADDIARVLKAADLNPLRATAFLEAHKAGNGADMVNAFLAEQAAAASQPNGEVLPAAAPER